MQALVTGAGFIDTLAVRLLFAWTDVILAKTDVDVSVVEAETDVVDVDADDDSAFDVLEDDFYHKARMDFIGLTLHFCF